VEQVAAEAGHLLWSLRVGVDRVVDGEAGVGPGEHAFDLLRLELAATLEQAEQLVLKQSLRGQGIGRLERRDRALRIDEAVGIEAELGRAFGEARGAEAPGLAGEGDEQLAAALGAPQARETELRDAVVEEASRVLSISGRQKPYVRAKRPSQTCFKVSW
jgi:hypothetical protein